MKSLAKKRYIQFLFILIGHIPNIKTTKDGIMESTSEISVIISNPINQLESSIFNQNLTITRILNKCTACSEFGHLNQFSELCQFNESNVSVICIDCKSDGHLNR